MRRPGSDEVENAGETFATGLPELDQETPPTQYQGEISSDHQVTCEIA